MKGGEFLIQDATSITTPEDLTSDHKLMRATAREFMDREALPKLPSLERHNWDVARKLLHDAGSLYLLGVDLPEEFGGLGSDKLGSVAVAEELMRDASIAVTIGAHIGIGTWPLVLFGTDEQKKKYLPRLIAGELVAAYALTEPHAGSDAMAIKTLATPTEDGQAFILNGSKMWISNAGFADLFTVYAQIPEVGMAAFLVEKNWAGVTVGKDESKLGLWASSTAGVSLEDVRVPKENLLGIPGKGHKIAFNVLNLGRFKLAAGCIGLLREALRASTIYARDRKAFDKSISEFGAISEKLANMAVRLYVGESVVYRLTGEIDSATHGALTQSEVMRGVEEYALECALAKVMLSELGCASADDAVQIHGGNGYSEEYPASRMYRDSRINRIFEGTNEINRLLAVGTLLKRAMSGKIALLLAFQSLQNGYSPTTTEYDDGHRDLYHALQGIKNTTVYLMGHAGMKFGLGIENEQEVMLRLAKLLECSYALESVLMRCVKISDPLARAHAENIVRVYCAEALTTVAHVAEELIPVLFDEDKHQETLHVLSSWLAHTPTNVVELKRKIARRVLET